MKVFLSWHRRKAQFRYPSEPVPRTAVLEPWFTSESGPRIRVFQTEPLESELERFAPQAIAGSWQQLDQLAHSVRCRGRIAPTHAVIVLHRGVEHVPLPAPFLQAADRDWLWRAFRVPIFEQLIGPRGVLLATECAAHDGLHIESPRLHHNGYGINGYMDASPCGCGRNTPRLLAAQPAERLRAIAAYAR